MASYIQMGHNSRNLLEDGNLNSFSGAILSPTNETKEGIILQVEDFQNKNFEMIFDPQLYYPNSERGHLPEWTYFPDDFDTADYSSIKWWDILNDRLTDVITEIRPFTVCSPTIVPRNFPDAYYEMNNKIAENLKKKIKSLHTELIITLLVRLSDLVEENRGAEISSIITSSSIDRAYLVFISDLEPRRELNNTEELTGAMKLIKYLEDSGMKIIVGFCSSDIILWKHAGINSCASGKFFNLRRFTPSRWEAPAKGGGQLAYWFEESLMVYLREADLQRFRGYTKISPASLKNPFCQEILNILDTDTGQPWLALSWRQYLSWFSDFENRFLSSKIDSNNLLKSSEKIWRDLDDNDVLFDEIQNDGLWIRRWRKAIIEFNKTL